MTTEIDLFGDAAAKPPRMKGQGRKTKVVENAVAEALDDSGDINYQVARARKEAWQAKMVELDYNIKQEAYVSRDEVRQVCATAYATLTQALRSIPDALERREGVTPEIAEVVGTVIDEVLSDLASSFERLGGFDE